MDFPIGISFLIVELLCIALTLLALLKTGLQRLESAVGISRDGFPPGRSVPSWQLLDLMGQERKTPTGEKWQLLIFVDHSLVSFPELFIGITHFSEGVPEVEVLIVSRDNRTLCEATKRVLNLQVPIVPVDQTFYDRFRVRIMPFAFFLNSNGVVHQLGLVNNQQQLFNMWKMTQAMIHNDDIVEEVVI